MASLTVMVWCAFVRVDVMVSLTVMVWCAFVRVDVMVSLTVMVWCAFVRVDVMASLTVMVWYGSYVLIFSWLACTSSAPPVTLVSISNWLDHRPVPRRRARAYTRVQAACECSLHMLPRLHTPWCGSTPVCCRLWKKLFGRGLDVLSKTHPTLHKRERS